MEQLLLEKKYSIKEVEDKVNLKFDCKIKYKIIKNMYYKLVTKLFGKPNNDANNLVELLGSLREKGNVCFSKLLSDEGHLEALIFATFDMLQFYKIYGDLIILDTTFGLNRFNMPLLTIAGVKNDGKTIILGFALVLNETFEYKLWALKEYLKFVNDEQPSAIISDACPALLKAVKEAFPLSKTFICGWHVQLNLKRHFSGLKKTLHKKSNIEFGLN